jgi:hypothetical protein
MLTTTGLRARSSSTGDDSEPVARADLEWIVHEFRDSNRFRGYRNAERYYDGDHDVPYDVRRFNSVFKGIFETVRLNVCPLVVDSMTDRLELEAFEIPGNAAAARRANELWKQNLMPLVSNEVHREAFKKGDSYVIVQPDTEGIPRVWFNEADCIVVRYSDNVPGRLEVAAKRWLANDRRYRLNVYYADHIERYVTDRKKSDYETEEPDWTAYVPYSPDDIATSEIIPWDYGQVPVFHFANASLYTYGKSELGDVIPLQKAINKTVGDLMITSEFASFRQRYAVGVDPEEATAAWMKGVERILTFTSPDAKLGEFSASDLGQFLEVINAFRRHGAAPLPL